MEEIKVEVGEYVRTKDGVIAKVLSDDGFFLDIDKRYFNEQYQNMRKFITHEQITKHSPNIIDLIEVGDYVNGDYVVKVYTYKNGNVQFIDVGELQQELRNKDIESVVTKEQFNSIKYEVEQWKK